MMAQVLLLMMLALAPARDLVFRDLEGRDVPLSGMLDKGPVVVAVFKTWCSTSAMSIPYYEKLACYGVPILLVGHNEMDDLKAFAARSSFASPIVQDPPPFRASRALGVRATPTLLLIGSDGTVLERVSPWNRAAVNRVSQRLAEMTGKPYVAVSTEGDGMPDERPG